MNNPFESVVGYDNIKTELLRIIDMMNDREKYISLGVKIPRGIILEGSPGVGKTLLCRCFIKASGRKAYICRKDKPDGDFVKHIRAVFDEAIKNAPSVVFLDDLDKFANGDGMHCNTDEFVTVQSCIDDVFSADVFVLATANDTDDMPESLLRAGRFDINIYVPYPKPRDTEAIIRHYLSEKSYVEDMDLSVISRLMEGKSCAELENVINRAGIYAGFSGNEKISESDILRACMRVIFNAPENDSPRSESFTRLIAIHEAGHAVVSELLCPESVNLVSVAEHDSGVCGITDYRRREDYFSDIAFSDERITVLLAGKAAVELVYGRTDTGASSDIHRAVNILERYVEEYSVNDYAVNDRHYGKTDQETLHNDNKYKRFKLDECYSRAKRLIAENRTFLDAVADALCENTTLTCRDITKLRLCA